MSNMIPASIVTAGQEVYLPDTRAWHIARAVEGHQVWFGMSSHPTVLRNMFYEVRTPSKAALRKAFDAETAAQFEAI